MNESDWLACKRPTVMLRFLRGRASERKLRLFLCACYRSEAPLVKCIVDAVSAYVDGNASRAAYEQAIQFMDGRAFQTQYEQVMRELEAGRAWPSLQFSFADKPIDMPISDLARAEYGAIESSKTVAQAEATSKEDQARTLGLSEYDAYSQYEAAYNAEREMQCTILRDIFPFRLMTIAPSLLNAQVVNEAQRIYDERRFEYMPRLATLLKEAGCDNEEILGHCEQGMHVRGCWLIDLILDKAWPSHR